MSAVQHIEPVQKMEPIERSVFAAADPVQRRDSMVDHFCKAVLGDTLGQLAVKLRWAADEWGADDARAIEIAKLCMQQVDTPDTPMQLPEGFGGLPCPHWDKERKGQALTKHSHRVSAVLWGVQLRVQ